MQITTVRSTICAVDLVRLGGAERRVWGVPDIGSMATLTDPSAAGVVEA